MELTKLAQRGEQSARNQDAALKRFLELLLALRHIILQDAAVLFSQFPTLSIFSFEPFNTNSFRAFASTSTRIIVEADEAARHRYQNLPEQFWAALRGYTQTNEIIRMQAEEIATKRHSDLVTTIGSLLNHSLANPNVKHSKKKYVQLSKGEYSSAKYQLCIDRHVASTEKVVLTPSHVHVASVIPPTQSPQPSDITTCNNIIHFPLLPSETPIQTPLEPEAPTHCRIVTSDPTERRKQLAAMAVIETQFGLNRVRNHCWEWLTKGSGKWIPLYTFVPVDRLTREEMWREYSEGLNGCLAIFELDQYCGPKWRSHGGDTLMAEASRRKKFYSLMQALISRPRWDRDKAFEYLNARWPIDSKSGNSDLRTTSQFVRSLSRRGAGVYDQIVKEADNFYQ